MTLMVDNLRDYFRCFSPKWKYERKARGEKYRDIDIKPERIICIYEISKKTIA